IAFRLRGTESNRDAVGALVELQTPHGSPVKQVNVGSGFLSQSSRHLYFGLGEFSGPLRAVITWPSGRRQTLTGLPADHRISVVEGEADWQAQPFRPRNFDLSPCPPQQPLKSGVRPEGYAFLEPVPTPRFALKDLAGETVASESFRGRPLLLNFWATWCVPCQEEMRLWNQHYADIRAAGANLLTISVDEPGEQEQVRSFVRERDLSFPVLLMDQHTLLRYNIFYRGLFPLAFDMQIPTTFLLDEQGNLVKLYRGVVPVETLLADLQILRQDPALLARQALPYPGRRFVGQFARDYGYLGADFVEHELFDDAKPYFERAVERIPTDGRSWSLLGVIYGIEGRLEEARQALERAVVLRPRDSIPHYHLGKAYHLLGQTPQALAALQRAVELDPTDPLILRLYAEVLLSDQRLDQAATAFRSYLELQPQDAKARNTLGAIYAQTGYLFLAEEELLRAIELQPDLVEAQKNLGMAYLKARRPAQAVAPLERTVQLAPQDADAFYLLGFAYAQTGQLVEARQALERVLELRPQDARARR
ncbi:MAG: tetratricopeptide repeat protein, partial [Terriglobia bacterium]